MNFKIIPGGYIRYSGLYLVDSPGNLGNSQADIINSKIIPGGYIRYSGFSKLLPFFRFSRGSGFHLSCIFKASLLLIHPASSLARSSVVTVVTIFPA